MIAQQPPDNDSYGIHLIATVERGGTTGLASAFT